MERMHKVRQCRSDCSLNARHCQCVERARPQGNPPRLPVIRPYAERSEALRARPPPSGNLLDAVARRHEGAVRRDEAFKNSPKLKACRSLENENTEMRRATYHIPWTVEIWQPGLRRAQLKDGGRLWLLAKKNAPGSCSSGAFFFATQPRMIGRPPRAKLSVWVLQGDNVKGAKKQRVAGVQAKTLQTIRVNDEGEFVT